MGKEEHRHCVQFKIMLRLKIKHFMRQRGVSQTALANAIADVLLESGESLSDRHLRYITQNTDPITRNTPKRKPSLVVLGFIIKGLRQLTGEDINVSDILEYQTETPETRATSLENDKDTEKNESLYESYDLATVISDPDTEKIIDDVWELTVHSLGERGYPELSQVAAKFNEASQDTTTPSTAKPKKRRGTLLSILIGLLIMLTSYLAFDQFFLKPRLIESYSRLFSFRDRVRPTSNIPVPTLIGPEGEIAQLSPTLRVLPVEKALAYEYYVENTVSNDGVYTGPILATSFVIPENTLCPNTTYTWRARALGNDGWTSFSSPLEFTVSSEALDSSQAYLLKLTTVKHKPGTPEIVSPIGTTNTTTPMLEVKKTPGIYGYGFYVRDLQNDGLVYDNNFVIENATTVPRGVLKDGGVYQWNARSRNCHYWSEFTPPQIFTVNVNE
jgi:hypothetical protein